jgi:hypothetical protein
LNVRRRWETEKKMREREREREREMAYPMCSRDIGSLHGGPEVPENFVAAVVGTGDMARLKPRKLHGGASDVQHHTGEINEGREEENARASQKEGEQ